MPHVRTKRSIRLNTVMSEETDQRLRWLCYENRLTPARLIEMVVADAYKRAQSAKKAPQPPQAPQPAQEP